MALNFHPLPGTIVICDFTGLVPPEMIKRRPVVVLSPKFKGRGQLATIVPLSTTAPEPVAPYHCQLSLAPPLPAPYDKPRMWVKGDMVYTLSTARMTLPFLGKDDSGKRIYDQRQIDAADFARIRRCVLNGLGLGELTGPV